MLSKENEHSLERHSDLGEGPAAPLPCYGHNFMMKKKKLFHDLGGCMHRMRLWGCFYTFVLGPESAGLFQILPSAAAYDSSFFAFGVTGI